MVRLAAVLALLVPAVARADSPAEQADALYKQGNLLVAAGKIAEGCAAFDQADKLDPTPSTRLHMANCREKNNQLATAWSLFVDVAKLTATGTSQQDQLIHKIAVERAAKLEPRLSAIVITVEAVPGLEIRRNATVIAPEQYGKPVPTDGGVYAISARAPGNLEWSTAVTVGTEHDTKTVAVPHLQPLVVAEAPAPEAPSHLPAYVVGAGGVALLGAALGFHLWGNATYDKANAAFEPEEDELWHSANTKRYLAESFAIGGAAAIGVAVWLYLRTPSEHAVAPMVSAQGGGIQVVGRW